MNREDRLDNIQDTLSYITSVKEAIEDLKFERVRLIKQAEVLHRIGEFDCEAAVSETIKTLTFLDKFDNQSLGWAHGDVENRISELDDSLKMRESQWTAAAM